MARFHINLEGKIYPCRAKIFKCPYSESNHADNKVELYYRLMGSENDVEPSKDGMSEINNLNRLKSLYSLSDDIAKSSSPVELVAQTLKEAFKKISDTDIYEKEELWKDYIKVQSEDVYDVLNGGLVVPKNVPEDIMKLGMEKFLERRGGVAAEIASSTGNRHLMRKRDALGTRDYSKYKFFREWELNKSNFIGTKRWIQHDFEEFTKHLNTSKMITQPIFYGDLDKARQTIKQMDNYELLAAYDDYSITDKEIEEAVKEARYFEYRERPDLTNAANAKMKEWYDRNKEIYKSWKANTSRRVLLSMEIAEELDNRGVLRADGSVAKMIKESEV